MGFDAITQGSNDLLNKIANDNSKPPPSTVELGQGIVNIKVKKIEEDDEDEDKAYLGWIKITAISKIVQKKSSSTSILYVDPTNTNNIKWENF